MAGVKPYSVEWIAPVFSHKVVEHAIRICITTWSVIYRCQRGNLAGSQYLSVVGAVADQSLGTVRAARGWSSFYGLVLVRPVYFPNVQRELALCPAGKHPSVDRLIRLRVRTRHENLLFEERGT